MLIKIINYYFDHLYDWGYHAYISVHFNSLNFLDFNAVFFGWFRSFEDDLKTPQLKDE